MELPSSLTMPPTANNADPLLILGEDEPPMQRMGKMCKHVRRHARTFSDRMVRTVRSLALDPRSPTISEIKTSDRRDDSVTFMIYAVYSSRDGTLLKIGMASSLKMRKELGYNDDDGIVVRAIFSIDNMPPEMDTAVVALYNKFWDAVRRDPKVDPYFCRLEKLVRDESAGALGIDKKICAGLLEYGFQRECSLSAPFEVMTGDVEVMNSRKASMLSAAKSMYPILDDVLQLHEFVGNVELFAVASWKTALVGMLRSSKIDMTENIVGPGNYQDTVEHVIFPNATTMEEVYGEEAIDWPPHILELALEIMHQRLASL